MGFGIGAGRALGQAFVDIRPRAGEFGADLAQAVNHGLTQVENQVVGTRIGRFLSSTAVSIAVTSAETLQNSLREVVTLGADVGPIALQLQNYTEDVRDLSTEYGRITNDVVPALYQALSAGVPRDNVNEFLATAAEAATAGVAELDESVAVLSASVNTFAEQGLTAAEASDLLFTAVKGGVTTFGELAASIGTAGPAAAAAGVEFASVTAAVATLTKAGIDTAQAATQLRALFNELAQAGTEVSKTFTEVAGVGFRQFTADGGTLVDALRLLNTEATESGVAIGDLFGSVEASTAATVLASGGFSEFTSQLNAASGAAGATSEAFDVMDSGLTANLNRIRAYGQELRQVFGAEFLPVAEDLAAAAVELAPTVMEIAEAFGGGLGQTLRLVAIPALKAITPPLEALAGLLDLIPEQVFAAAVAYRTLYRLTSLSLVQTAGVKGLEMLSGRLLNVAVSADQAGKAASAMRLTNAAAGASNAATRVSTLATSVSKLGSAVPIAGAALAIGIPFIMGLGDNSREAAERLQVFTERVEAAGGTTVDAAITNISALADALAGVSDEAEGAAGAAGDAVAIAVSGAIADKLNDPDVIAKLGGNIRDLVEFASADASREFALLGALLGEFDVSDLQRGAIDTSAINETTQAFLDLALAAGLTNDEASKLAAALGESGEAFDSFVTQEADKAADALTRTTDELANVPQYLIDWARASNTASDGTVDWVGALNDVNMMLDPVTTGVAGYVEGLRGVSELGDDAADANSKIGTSYSRVIEPVSRLVDELGYLADAYRTQFDLAASVEDAQRGFRREFGDLEGLQEDVIGGLAAAQASGGQALADYYAEWGENAEQAFRTLREGSVAGDAARESIQGQAEALLDLIDAQEDNNVSLEERNRTLDQGRKRILDEAEALGINRRAVRALLDEVLLLPDDITVQVFTDRADFDAWIEDLNAIPNPERRQIIADVTFTQNYLDWLNQSGGDFDIPGAPQPSAEGADGLLIGARSGGQLILAGEAGDNEVLINPRSSIDRQMYLARESGLLDNILGAVGGAGAGVTINQTIRALSYDERVLAQFAREAVRDVLTEVSL